MNKLERAKSLLKKLMTAGYEAYLVGGCVRDKILNKEPHDYDITTNATPEEVKNVLTDFNIIDTGLKHGTVTVMYDHDPFEITTYREDGVYSDYRHPDSVSFSKNIDDDLSRRDFTINAMAEDFYGNIVDPFKGQNDMLRKIIRCVGIADERFKEDPLRMLRAIRFSLRLGFYIEEETKKAIIRNANLITKISNERIRDELREIITLSSDCLILLKETNLLKYILPEVDCLDQVTQNNKWHYTDVFHHTVDALKHTDTYTISQTKLFYARLVLILHDTGKPKAKIVGDDGFEHFYGHPEYSYEIALDVLKRLKFTNDEIDLVSKLVRYHDETLKPTRKTLFKVVNDFNMSLYEFKLLGYIREADIFAHVKRDDDDRMPNYFKVLNMYKQKLKRDKMFKVEDLVINGKDIMDIYGLKQGKIIGTIKNDLFNMCFYKPSLNTKEYLIDYLKKNKEKYFPEESEDA